MDPSIAVFYPVFNQPKATYECLKGFRKFYPDVPIRLSCNNGYDFTKIAEYFHCDYVHEKENLYSDTPPYALKTKANVYEALGRLRRCCEKYDTVDWILWLEDDVLTRGPIKHTLPAPLAGPCSCEFTNELKEFVRKKYPWLQIYGYSGCGGTIIHREIFLRCLGNMFDIDEAQKLDDRVRWYFDAILTYLFLYNGYECKPWLDQSESRFGKGLPDAAFDHQYKVHYNKPWDDSMLGQ